MFGIWKRLRELDEALARLVKLVGLAGDLVESALPSQGCMAELPGPVVTAANGRRRTRKPAAAK